MNEKRILTRSLSERAAQQRADYRAQKEKLMLLVETGDLEEGQKRCFKCGEEKPLTEFHLHPRMADGHLGKCKVCTRMDVDFRRREKEKTDLDWVLAERERHRIKTAKNRKPQTAEQYKIKNEKYKDRYPQKQKARQLCGNAIRDGKLLRQPCIKCGAKAQAHHEDYMKPLEVTWLCPKHHAERHIQIRTEQIVKSFNH